METKVREYLEAGVRMVWVAYPRQRTIHIYRDDGTSDLVTGDGVLAREDVIPGFQCAASEIFQRP